MSLNLGLAPSLWQQTATKPPKFNQLSGDITADVTIIGAGFTGLRAALELVQKGVDVVVLDSYEPGWGASGRNGGQVNPMAHSTPEEIIQQLGPVYGPRMLESYANSANELFQVVKQHDLKCEAAQNGWLRGAHCRSAAKTIEKMSKGWAAAGLDIDLVEGEELHRLTGSSAYDVATRVKSGGNVQPLSYARELARVAHEKGARIYTNSKVQQYHKHGDKWRVVSASGSVSSEWVIFCTNGYTENTLKGLKQTIVPLVSVQAATRLLSDEEYSRVLPEGHTLSDSRRVVYYTRKDHRGRLVFGSMGRVEGCAISDKKRLQNGLKQVFPQFSADDLEFYWGGRLAITTDHLPHLHEPASGILAGLGYNGRGVAMATVMGRILSERVLGKRTEDLAIPSTPFKSFRLKPFHQLGMPIAIKYFELRDSLDV